MITRDDTIYKSHVLCNDVLITLHTKIDRRHGCDWQWTCIHTYIYMRVKWHTHMSTRLLYSGIQIISCKLTLFWRNCLGRKEGLASYCNRYLLSMNSKCCFCQGPHATRVKLELHNGRTQKLVGMETCWYALSFCRGGDRKTTSCTLSLIIKRLGTTRIL